MLEKKIALRIDVDTSVGLRRGVPRLLDLLKRTGIKSSFFIVTGPDTMGRHIFRLKKKNYIKRIKAFNPVKLIRAYGISPFLYGTFLKGPHVIASCPDVVKRIGEEGHELNLHGYDHSLWADNYNKFGHEDIDREMTAAIEKFRSVTGRVPVSSAAPNWRCTDLILEREDRLGFRYLSDCRGETPFFPATDKGVLQTLQMPQTMPTFLECIQQGLCAKENAAAYLLNGCLRPDTLNLFTLHDWYEGMNEIYLAEQFIKGAINDGYTFSRMDECAGELLRDPSSIPVSKVVRGSVPGGIGDVSVQSVEGRDKGRGVKIDPCASIIK